MFAPFQYVEDCFLSVIDHTCGLYLEVSIFHRNFRSVECHSKLLGVKAKVVVVDGVPIALKVVGESKSHFISNSQYSG